MPTTVIAPSQFLINRGNTLIQIYNIFFNYENCTEQNKKTCEKSY